MESQADGGYDLGGPDHIRHQPNPCGVVYALDLAPDAAVGSDHVATRISGLLAGTPIQYGKKDPYAGNRCDITGIASPDNLHVLPHPGVLLVAERTSEQVVDSVWAHDLRDQTLTRIFTAPYGAETSGVYGYRLGDWSYVRIMVHDPFTGLGVPEPKSPDELAGWDGVLGPLPPLGP